MTTKQIGYSEFPSVAEATAHFYKLGFHTTNTTDDARYMRNSDNSEAIMITHQSLLCAEAKHFSLKD